MSEILTGESAVIVHGVYYIFRASQEVGASSFSTAKRCQQHQHTGLSLADFSDHYAQAVIM